MEVFIMDSRIKVMQMKRLPIGISDFKKLIENNYYFIDTSGFISDIYREPADIVLIKRPRRLGKIYLMKSSMIQPR